MEKSFVLLLLLREGGVEGGKPLDTATRCKCGGRQYL